MAVITITGILLSLSISGLSSLGKPDSVTLATEQVTALLEQAHSEAKASGEYRALLLSCDPSDHDSYRRLTIARFPPTNVDEAIDPLSDKLKLRQRWLTLPPHTAVEIDFNNRDIPNLFYAGGNDTEYLCHERASSVTDKHPDIRYIIFDGDGAVVSKHFSAQNSKNPDNNTLSKYVNEQTSESQKGAFMFIREARVKDGAVTPRLDELDSFQVNSSQQTLKNVNGKLIYLSPLTSAISLPSM